MEDMNDYYIDCGSCGGVFAWAEYKENDMYCPRCGWDSVRMSLQTPVATEDESDDSC